MIEAWFFVLAVLKRTVENTTSEDQKSMAQIDSGRQWAVLFFVRTLSLASGGQVRHFHSTDFGETS